MFLSGLVHKIFKEKSWNPRQTLNVYFELLKPWEKKQLIELDDCVLRQAVGDFYKNENESCIHCLVMPHVVHNSQLYKYIGDKFMGGKLLI